MNKFLIFLGILIITNTSLYGQEAVVKTASGNIRGETKEGVTSFLGVPYAKPPIGKYRWRPPQPLQAWGGIRDAKEFGFNCAQAGWPRTSGKIAEGSSEDCLYLNLWLPEATNAGSKLPVMVWIHGGGFVGGSGSSPENAGHQFAKQGVILVTINYRLGRLGFFAFPALNEEFPDEPKGNYAYMDQIAALEWIQKNISEFGGDPDNVTIFGFSAGGVSVHSLMTIPKAKGLFHKAISQSGGGRDGVLTARPIDKENADVFYKISAETIGVNFARKHGIEGVGKEALEKLRSLSIEEIVDGGLESDGPGGPRTYSGPILDGKLVKETAESAYLAGRQAKVPLIIGSNSAEIGGNFVNGSKSKQELFSLFEELSEEAKVAFDPEGDKPFEEVITKFNTDWVWAEPGRFTAKVFAKSDEPTYVYQFSYVPEAMKQWMKYGAGHGSEVAYVFDKLDSRRRGPQATEVEYSLARMMNTYWANFAKTGDPNGDGVPNWPIYTPQGNQILDIQADGNPVGKIDPRNARLNVIEKASGLRSRLQSRGI